MSELNQNLNRGLQVAEILQDRLQLSLKELAAATGFTKQSILRTLETLIHRGWVRKRVNDWRYIWIGMPLATNFSNGQLMAKLSMGLVQQLSTSTGLVADLALLDDKGILTIIDSTRPRGSEGININVTGYQPSLSMTALGRAFWFANTELSFTLRYEQLLKNADFAERDYLQKKLWGKELQRFQKHAYTQRESTDYIPQIVKDSTASMAIAVVINGPQVPLGALNLVWDRMQLSCSEVVEKHLTALLRCAEDIQLQLVKLKH
ncbi:MAG: helix-turn-helix domain-containing protein [Pseudomonadales bacterium]|nr:helix-turn-helix domain-containing protein [Pseudomonadales bacterium]NRA14399.1 helix-turn-helix domain-containing protein [Oceanospirillaceae bacterium]